MRIGLVALGFALLLGFGPSDASGERRSAPIPTGDGSGGSRIDITDDQGNVIGREFYDRQQQRQRDQELDESGNVTRERTYGPADPNTPGEPGPVRSWTDYEYDENGRPTGITSRNPEGRENWEAEIEYDAEGRPRRVTVLPLVTTDEEGNRTEVVGQLELDEQGRVVKKDQLSDRILAMLGPLLRPFGYAVGSGHVTDIHGRDPKKGEEKVIIVHNDDGSFTSTRVAPSGENHQDSDLRGSCPLGRECPGARPFVVPVKTPPAVGNRAPKAPPQHQQSSSPQQKSWPQQPPHQH